MTQKNRKDTWSSDEDLMLAAAVIEQIKFGGTQLRAFELAGEQLSRTSSACGFRWNSNLRKSYEKEIKQAKQERKKESNSSVESKEQNKDAGWPNVSFKELLGRLEELYEEIQEAAQSTNKEEIKELEKQNKELVVNNQVLIEKNKELEVNYQSLLKVIEQAGKMVILQNK